MLTSPHSIADRQRHNAGKASTVQDTKISGNYASQRQLDAMTLLPAQHCEQIHVL